MSPPITMISILVKTDDNTRKALRFVGLDSSRVVAVEKAEVGIIQSADHQASVEQHILVFA